MRKFFFAFAIVTVISVLLPACDSSFIRNGSSPSPNEGDEDEQRKRELYFELMHRAAPGTDWKSIEYNNLVQADIARNAYLASRNTNTTSESFANGALLGDWEEKGSDNIAGRVNGVAYDSVANNLYLISHGGTLWKKNLAAGNWEQLNKTYRFKPDIINIFKKANGTNRLLLATNGILHYSDDDGTTITPSLGITYPVAWGGNNITNVITTSDPAHIVYCLVFAWDPVPWQPRYWLYRSTDQGLSFTKIYTFSHGDDGKLSMNKPHNANDIYILDSKTNTGAITIYKADATITQLNTFTSSETNKRCNLKGTKLGLLPVLYAMFENNRLYVSNDLGASWTLKGTLTENSWDRLAVSMNDENKVFFGGVNTYRSINAGTNWILVNSWGEYYANPATKLHADIMEIMPFRRQDGTTFMVVNTDGGCYTSNDDLVTVSNISLNSLRTGQFYDILTDPDQPNNLFAGSQDQGFQRNTIAQTAGALNFTQVISGDYGSLVLTGSPKHLWMQYPGGVIYYYNNPLGGPNLTWNLPGSQFPWMVQVKPTSMSSVNNEVLIGGGNINGGTGSYLVKLTASTTTPFTITPSQYSYNFMANSNNGNAAITAIEASSMDQNKIYVATGDGTFFYSTDAGNTWTKTSSFSGPGSWYLYGSSIYSSKLTPGLIWYAGSGYSNPAVYKSVNGGQTFTPMNNNLPATLVYEIVANPSETMLFAATEAGPFVYVVAINQWYPMMGLTNPYQTYTCVEYIAASNTVRFGTYGRGIWDFKISNTTPPGPTIATSGSLILCDGANVLLTSSAATGNQWYRNGVAIPSATNTTYQATQSGSYTVTFTVNNITSNPSLPTLVVVNPVPSTPSLTASGPTTFCSNDSVTITSSLSSGIKWYRDGVLITSATNSTFVAKQSGNYTATLTASGCTSNSSNAINVIVNPVPAQPTITSVSYLLRSSSAVGNQWFLAGTSIPGATNQDYGPTSSGLYSVQVTVNGCTSPMSTAFNHIYTAVNSPVLEKNIIISPNPVVQTLFIRYKNNSHPMQLKLLDVTGKLLAGNLRFTDKLEIDLGRYPKGVYVVLITDTKTNEHLQKKIVKE